MSQEIKRDIPGEYGPPILGPVLDRLDRFYGMDFFEKRIDEYSSTVFRVNMPPGPPFFPSSHVITVLDQKCFPFLFDLSKVSKKDTFTGTYVPSTGFTGGFRVLSYLDPIEDEPKHTQLKTYCFEILKSNSSRWVPELRAACARGFAEWDAALDSQHSSGLLSSVLSSKSTPELNPALEKIALGFLTKTILDKDATQSSGIFNSGLTGTGIKLWIAPQIAPVLNAGLPAVIQEALMHTFPIPFIVVEPEYLKIVSFFSKNGGRALGLAKNLGIGRDEALHNLIFFLCFNAFGGMTILWPAVFKQISDFTEFDLQSELRQEVRAAVDTHGGELTGATIDSLPLLQSTIYEVLRLEPPVPSQYGRARVDFVLETHTEAFQVKKGEMLYGYQPLVTRDPKVFDDPNEFKPKRFMGADGHKLLQHVFWSNGPETSDTSTQSKQCGGKNLVVLSARVVLAEFFLYYDAFKLGDASISGTSSTYPFTELKKRS